MGIPLDGAAILQEDEMQVCRFEHDQRTLKYNHMVPWKKKGGGGGVLGICIGSENYKKRRACTFAILHFSTIVGEKKSQLNVKLKEFK